MNENRTETGLRHPERPLADLLRDQEDETAKTSRQTLYAAVTASPVPIVVIDVDTTVRLWNPAAERLFGYSKKQVSDGSIPIVSFEERNQRRANGLPGIQAIVRIVRWKNDQGGASDPGFGRLLQSIVEAGKLLSGAQFGAASFNVVDEAGLHYLLYAVAGTPQDLVGTCAMPRKIGFASLSARVTRLPSAGVGQVMSGRWYGGSILPQGARREEFPVDGFLALPIVGHSGEVCGGLFLDHPDPDVFTKESQRVVAALAAYAGIAIDNACRFQAERDSRSAAEEANRAKDEFLAVLSHELRNPLSTVRNAIETTRLNPVRRDRALEVAAHGVEQLARMTDDLLDLTRITHGKLTLHRAVVSVEQIVQRAIESARHRIATRGLTISVSSIGEHLQVDGDAFRLEQVIGNLLSNAVKYTDPGGHIAVTVTNEEGGAVVRVRDTGMGIVPEALPCVFDLFVQADESRHRAQGGLGIGLALVKRLVEIHGGRVEAYSDGHGRGAELVVRLPAVHWAGNAATSDAPVPLDAATCTRVLVVDDNAEAAEVTTLLLETVGHQVRTALDGRSALQAALADPPDVMLVDIGLPGMDGYEVAQTVRQHEGLRQVRLVALTGYGSDEDRQHAFAAGFEYHLAKPVNIAELLTLVGQLAGPTQPPMQPA